jgi:hypothetical protein
VALDRKRRSAWYGKNRSAEYASCVHGDFDGVAGLHRAIPRTKQQGVESDSPALSHARNLPAASFVARPILTWEKKRGPVHFDGHAGADVGGDRNAGCLFDAELSNDASERKSSLLLREFASWSHLAMILLPFDTHQRAHFLSGNAAIQTSARAAAVVAQSMESGVRPRDRLPSSKLRIRIDDVLKQPTKVPCPSHIPSLFLHWISPRRGLRRLRKKGPCRRRSNRQRPRR